ncbi:DNA-binding response regulator [Streptomyces sp. NPDC049627]|uniref:DNA-binding response regulator n=1 Tax=Streptomyces sp. NPDC049627 TaxID=3365595 RepID=UPI0037BC87E4
MIRVLLAEDMGMVRGALVALLEMEQDLSVVAQVADGREVLSAGLTHRPDVAVIDVGLPGVDGIEAATQLHEHLPDCRTVMLTGMDQPGTVRRAMNAMVFGYLLKDAPPSELATAIRKVAAGQRVIDTRLAFTFWHRDEHPLTERESDVLSLASEGAEVSEIAAQLHLAVGTVRNYLSSAVSKLGARNRLDAVRIARDAGWI